jgi:hypothetical protein
MVCRYLWHDLIAIRPNSIEIRVSHARASALATTARHATHEQSSTPSHVLHLLCSLLSSMEAKLYVGYPLLPLCISDPSFSHSKSLKVADLKEICTRANVPTTTRSTKADLITKILSSQSAVDAYKAKYKQDEIPAPISRPPVLSNNDDIVCENASISRVILTSTHSLLRQKSAHCNPSFLPPFFHTSSESTGH